MNRDHLDHAIDHVASRMTRVEHDTAFAEQIVNTLPERSTWHGWLFPSWVPRLAMLALVTAGMVWSLRGSPEDVTGTQPLASVPLVPALVEHAASVKKLEPVMRRLEPESLEPWEPAVADFAHSLAAIAAVAPLELEAIAPESLSEDAPLTLAPLVIDDLPAAESISPREEL